MPRAAPRRVKTTQQRGSAKRPGVVIHILGRYYDNPLEASPSSPFAKLC